jgi:hypothetical protein
VIRATPTRHGWAYRLADRLQWDHELQIRFHRWAIVFWAVNVPAAVALLVVFPGAWVKFSVLYVLLLSLYANADTDYDAMSAAEAALHAQHAERNTTRPDAVAPAERPAPIRGVRLGRSGERHR